MVGRGCAGGVGGEFRGEWKMGGEWSGERGRRRGDEEESDEEDDGGAYCLPLGDEFGKRESGD